MTRRPTRVLAATAIATVTIALTFQGWVLYESRGRALQAMHTRAANRAQATAGGVESVFRRLDMALLAVRDQTVPEQVFRGPTATTRAREAEMRQLLLAWQARGPDASRLHVISAEGQFVYSTVHPVPTVRIDDRPYFLEQKRAVLDEFRLSETHYSRVSHKWGIFGSRSIRTSDGTFAGIVMVAVDVESLAREMTAVDQAQWFLATFDANRALVASNPVRPDAVGKPFEDPFLATGLERGRSSHHGRALAFGANHLWATRKVASLPLLTVAGISESVALAQWRHDLVSSLIVAALLIAGCLAILVVQRRNDRATEAIRALSERVKLAANSVKLGIWDWDAHADRVTWDEVAGRLMGAPDGALTGTRDEWLARVLPEDRARLFRPLPCREEPLFEERIRIPLGNGAVRYLRTSGLLECDEAGRPKSAVGIVWDVTQDELVAHQLQASEEYFRTLFDAVPHAVAVIEAGRVVDSNRPYREMFEIDADETRPPWLLLGDATSSDEPTRQVGQRFYEEALTGHLPQANWPCRRCRGEPFEAEIRARLFPHEGRQLVVATVRDLTEQRSMEEKLHQAQKLDALGQLAGGVAHDFNNMLAAILASAELLSPDESREVQKELRETIVAAAERAAQLTSKLLAFARKGKFRSTPIDVHGIVKETVALLERTIDRRITISLELGATRPTVRGDPSQLQSALLNLGVNARDAMPSGGSLVIKTENRILSEAECILGAFHVSPGDYVTVSVIDDGEGIEPKILKQVFDPFFTTKETGKGTGLGLAAVFGSMASHQGAVTVESRVGEGSRFTLFLPVAEVDSPVVDATAQTVARGSGLVLVIDDEELVRTATAMQLESLGYGAVVLGDPERARESYLEHRGRFVAVLVDMVMPKVMGLDVAAELRALDASLPIVLVSGFPKTEQLEHWLGKTIDGFLQKPFNQAELGQMLAAVRLSRRTIEEPALPAANPESV